MNHPSNPGCLAAALLVASLAAGCATTAPKYEAYKSMPIGSTWTYAQHNSGSYAVQFGAADLQVPNTLGERVWEGRNVLAFSGPQGTLIAEPSGPWLAVLLPGDKPVLRYDPPFTFDMPLAVGKTWTKHYQLTVMTGQTLPMDVACKVQSYENAVVPAGTFPSFKMSCSFSTGLENTSWFSPELGIFVKTSETRGATYRGGPGTQQQELVSLNIKK